ncbi:MAG: helix-turn-helix domain-containing protein [Nocardioidaceae bacterium]
MNKDRWGTWLAHHQGSRTQIQLAKALDVSASTVSRWLSGDITPDSAGLVADVAVRLGANVMGAYLAAGFITEDMYEQIMAQPMPADARSLSDDDLASEVRRRLGS